MNSYTSYSKFYSIVLIFVFLSCSTTKDNFLNRKYHQTTTKFNGYFNGSVSFNSGLKHLEDTYVDDFSQILPIYIIGDKKDAQSLYSYMDNAIRKASIVITKHSMNIKNKQKNKWIDDNYLLIGKSRFYKREYIEALDAFSQVQSIAKNDKIYFDALYWTARCYLELENYIQANNYIEMIEVDPKLPSRLEDDIYAVYADIFIREKKYEDGIESLKNALAKTRGRENKARYNFIIGQIYQSLNDLEKASIYYETVVKINPNYDMVFNALMKQASCFAGENNRAIINSLKDMLKDEKNLDYQDQIYYAMAEVYFNGGIEEKGIDFINKSIRTSTINNPQKALSYLKLATLYLDKKKYVLSQAYYDSTVTFISTNNEQYEDILNKKNSLTDLVLHLNTIHNQDSLLQLASLDSIQIEKIIMGAIKDLKNKEKELLQASKGYYQNKSETQRNNASTNRMSGGNGNWYFYNPTTVSFGFNEFNRIWGQRRLEDNWRRKNKELNMFISDIDSLNEDGSLRETDIYNPEYYLQDIPFTNEEKEIAVVKIIDAYYQLSLVYKEKLDDLLKSSKALEDLLMKYPGNKYELQCYYNLYRNYSSLKENNKAKKYEKILLDKYPASDFAKLIENPNYLEKKGGNENKATNLYTETYTFFLANNINKVLDNCDSAFVNYPKNDLIPKFYLLNAMAIGKKKDKSQYLDALNTVINLFPGEKEAQEAKNIILILSGKIPEEKPLYDFVNKVEHFYVLLCPNTGFKSNDIKSAFSDFNKEFFSLETLTVKSLFLDENYQLITIRGFENSSKALQYFNTIKGHEEVLRHLNGNSYEHFVISSSNFTTYYTNKNTILYLDFFKTNYLTQN